MPTFHFKKENSEVAILFSFVPKSGGTSLIEFFRLLGFNVYMHNENNPIVGFLKCPSQHFHYEILDSIYNIEKFSTSFSIIRNPISKLRSDYLWSMHFNNNRKELWPSFDIWFEKMFLEFRKNEFYFDNHLRQQSEFVGNKIQLIYPYELGLENIVKSIFQFLKIKIEWDKFDIKMPEKNSSLKNTGILSSSNNINISNNTLEIIKDFYQCDFELWEKLVTKYNIDY